MYAACDVFVTAAEIGESHSYAIEEAMALRLPVVTSSTPWVDNAQIEQVDEGKHRPYRQPSGAVRRGSRFAPRRRGETGSLRGCGR